MLQIYCLCVRAVLICTLNVIRYFLLVAIAHSFNTISKFSSFFAGIPGMFAFANIKLQTRKYKL